MFLYYLGRKLGRLTYPDGVAAKSGHMIHFRSVKYKRKLHGGGWWLLGELVSCVRSLVFFVLCNFCRLFFHNLYMSGITEEVAAILVTMRIKKKKNDSGVLEQTDKKRMTLFRLLYKLKLTQT